MKSRCSNHMVLLLFLSFNSHLFTRAASTSPPVTQSQIVYLTAADSDDDEHEKEEHLTPHPEVRVSVKKTILHQEPPEPCQLNPCLEDQAPCPTLSQQTGCLCPGLSGASEPPHAPQIHELLPVKEGPDSGKIEVQWCAPPSVVSGYRVTVEGNGLPQEFKDTKRRGVVGYLEAGDKVCVEAVNNAGHSSPSCKRYEPPATFDHNMMFGVVAGAVILLLLVIIGTAVCCKYRICQRTKRDSNDGLGNPSYTAAGTL